VRSTRRTGHALSRRPNKSQSPSGKPTERFDQVGQLLQDLDIETVWEAADFKERRGLVEEFVESVTFFADHVEVRVAGSPKLNVLLSEVGLRSLRLLVSEDRPTQGVHAPSLQGVLLLEA
jgi:hypothetical protein